MAKGRRRTRRPLKTKAFFVFAMASIFSLIVIVGLILYLGYRGKEGATKGASTTTVAKVEKPQLIPPVTVPTLKPKIAIIIDDLGQDMKQIRDILTIDAPVAVAILPFLPHSKDIAEQANTMGREVLLHLPMEPKDPQNNDPGQGALFTDMSESSVAEQVKRDINAVPHIIGINNHMGSRFTEDEKLMRKVLEITKGRDLFFLDSKTTNKSAAYRLARDMGVKAARREVFLDNNEDVDYIKGQILELIEIAKKRGSAIAIGHPHPTTITAIKEMLPELHEDVDIVPLSSLVH